MVDDYENLWMVEVGIVSCYVYDLFKYYLVSFESLFGYDFGEVLCMSFGRFGIIVYYGD